MSLQIINTVERFDAEGGDGIKFEAGEYEYALFTLADGTELKVSLTDENTAIEIHNNGRRMRLGLVIEPNSTNNITIRPREL